MKNWLLRSSLCILFLSSLISCEWGKEGNMAPSGPEPVAPSGENEPSNIVIPPQVNQAPPPPATGTTTPGGTPTTPPSGGTTPGGFTPRFPGWDTTRIDTILDRFGTRPTISVTAPTTPSSFDLTLPLTNKIYNVQPLEVTGPDGRRVTLDPLAEIEIESNGTMRFRKTAPQVSPTENFLEVNLNVLVPSRLRYNAQTGRYAMARLTDWFQIDLWACNGNNPCQLIKENIPSTDGSIPCTSPNTPPKCERTFHTIVQSNSIPGGDVAANDTYLVAIKGTNEAKYHDRNGYLQACTYATAEQDCYYSHPWCESGICTGMMSGNYFRVDTPADLRAMR